MLRKLEALWLAARIKWLEAQMEESEGEILFHKARITMLHGLCRKARSRLAVVKPASELLKEALRAPRTRL